MKRLLLFIGVFLVTALLVFGGVFGLNWKSFSVFFDNREAMTEGAEWIDKTYSLVGLSEYIAQNPEHVSFTSSVIGAPDSTLYYRENEPRAMGFGANIFLMIGIADQIEAGTFSAEEMIAWSDITQYQLPEVDASAHKISYNAAVDRGWISNGEIQLQHAAQLLPEFKDLALADYFWWKLGPEYWPELKERLNLQQTDMPLPYSGLYQAIAPSLQERTAEEILEHWGHSTSEFRDYAIGRSDTFLNDRESRSEITEKLKRDRLGLNFMEERNALVLFPRTTAAEMGSLLEQLWSDEIISPEVSQNVKLWMNWPMESQKGISQNFSNYGAIYDSRMGLLMGIDFGTSTYTGDTTVQAVFFDRLPVAFWFHMSSNHMHHDFLQRMIYDPAMIDQMKSEMDRYAQN